MSFDCPLDILAQITPIVHNALHEDWGLAGDISSHILYGHQDKTANFTFKARQNGVLSGLEIIQLCYAYIDKNVTIQSAHKNGMPVKKGEVFAQIDGSITSLLSGERVCLNFLSRLCAIATQTAQFVAIAKPYNVRIAATRKTTPGLRIMEKQAVLAGGGYTHRLTLSGAIMIKDNHIAAMPNGLANIWEALKNVDHMTHISIEVDTEAQFDEITDYIQARPSHNTLGLPNVIVLDNMSVSQMHNCVQKRNQKGLSFMLEASGGIGTHTIKNIAKCGIDIISMGAITHNPPPFDIGLDFNTASTRLAP